MRSQWCPCTFGNGEKIAEGVAKLDRWLREVEPACQLPRRDAEEGARSLPGALMHVREAARLLVSWWACWLPLCRPSHLMAGLLQSVE